LGLANVIQRHGRGPRAIGWQHERAGMSQRVRAAAVGELHPSFPTLESPTRLPEMFDCPLGVGECEYDLTGGERSLGDVFWKERDVAHGRAMLKSNLILMLCVVELNI
jgi:hypothetical protein